MDPVHHHQAGAAPDSQARKGQPKATDDGSVYWRTMMKHSRAIVDPKNGHSQRYTVEQERHNKKET